LAPTLELRQFNVRVRLVIPGRAPETRFGENASPKPSGRRLRMTCWIAIKLSGTHWVRRFWIGHAPRVSREPNA
jgi:hypothetical protein